MARHVWFVRNRSSKKLRDNLKEECPMPDRAVVFARALYGLFSLTTVPLRIWTYIGLTVASFALIYMMVIVIRVMIFGIDVPGCASLIVTLTFFSGLNMIGLGVLGEYMGRVFMEVKRRPLYLVDETQGFDKNQSG
jgi:hypothetical protein